MYLDACTTYSGKCAKEKKKLHGEEERKGREKQTREERQRGIRARKAGNLCIQLQVQNGKQDGNYYEWTIGRRKETAKKKRRGRFFVAGVHSSCFLRCCFVTQGCNCTACREQAKGLRNTRNRNEKENKMVNKRAKMGTIGKTRLVAVRLSKQTKLKNTSCVSVSSCFRSEFF